MQNYTYIIPSSDTEEENNSVDHLGYEFKVKVHKQKKLLQVKRNSSS